MEARNRNLPDWFTRIRSGQIRLPRFQRFEAWSHNEVSGLLETVLQGLPTGVALILEVGDQEKFKSRVLQGAPITNERVTEHLLDGQQRLTALWRSMHDDYSDRTYFVHYDMDEETDSQILKVTGLARWERGNRKYPVWADVPKEAYDRGFIPVRLLRPGDIDEEILEWCDLATVNDPSESRKLERQIYTLRRQVTSYNIPFLSLPSDTSRDVALGVFIKMNTSSVRLTEFDIVVAQVEDEIGTSLHDLVEELNQRVPHLEGFIESPNFILNIAALREGKTPTNASYQRLEFEKLAREWDSICKGIQFAVEFLEQERVFDSSRLPTTNVLPVLSALYDHLPRALDELGNARILLRKYIWRAFLTRRYENAASSKSYQDYKALVKVLREKEDESVVPIFDETMNPLPTIDELKRAGWPKAKDILARGILAISLRSGAHDLADGTPISRDNVRQREYHHLFPDSLLTKEGLLSAQESYRALNCALITWKTNRNISAKEPIKYLTERTDRSSLGEQVVLQRLSSHVIPYDELNVGGYDSIMDEEERRRKIRNDYEAFLNTRANMVLEAVKRLCEGNEWSPSLANVIL